MFEVIPYAGLMEDASDETAAAWWWTYRFFGADEALKRMMKWGF